MQILTANYTAEYGRSSGGQIRMVTKSGSRSFQGSAYEYFRNEKLDANTWAFNRVMAAAPREARVAHRTRRIAVEAKDAKEVEEARRTWPDGLPWLPRLPAVRMSTANSTASSARSSCW